MGLCEKDGRHSRAEMEDVLEDSHSRAAAEERAVGASCMACEDEIEDACQKVKSGC